MSAKIHTYLNMITANWILIIGLLITLANAVTMIGEFHQHYPTEWVNRESGVDILRTGSLVSPAYFQRDPELREPMRLNDFSTYSLVKEDIASLSYMSRLNKCFDVPFSELASCQTVQ